MSVLEGFQPASVFKYFEEICNIPHGSGNIEAISDYLKKFAEDRNLPVVQDEVKNIIITKEASEGYEDVPGIVLQGHMDMVCASVPERNIDMTKEPLKLVVDGDYLRADGTSLGGDDGIAVAYSLAILDDDSIKHPRLEVVITVEEETGMDGAKALDMSLVKGRRFLNIDSEEEGIFWVGCAGGARIRHNLPVGRTEISGKECNVLFTGLTGGHSGGEIHKNRANSNSLTGNLLDALLKVDPELGVIDIEGGTADNAIARETKITLVISSNKESAVLDTVAALEKEYQEKYAVSDPDFSLTAQTGTEVSALAATGAEAEKIAKILMDMPNGVIAYSKDIEGLVETSLNNGVIKLEADKLTFVTSVRSSVEAEKEKLIDRITAVTTSMGGTVKRSSDYPGWEYKKESPFRDLCAEVYKEMTGEDATIAVIHAGLECGLFLSKCPDLDCVSMGPNMMDIHTFQEKLSISSTERVWQFILKVLAAK